MMETKEAISEPNSQNESSSPNPDTDHAQDRIKVTYHDRRSHGMAALQYVLKPFRPRAVTPNKEMPGPSSQLKPHFFATGRCSYTERKLNGVYVYDLQGKKPLKGDFPRKRIYYFSGGSWQMPPSTGHWRFCAEVARRIPNCTVSVVSHGLAPRSPASQSMPQLAGLYREAMVEAEREGEQIVFAGDSSGGNIALCLTAWMVKEGESPPAGVMAICATTDLRHTDPAILVAEQYDPIMTAKFVNEAGRKWTSKPGKTLKDDYVPATAGTEWTASDPRISPCHAQLELLAEKNVKVHGVTASYDVLAPEAISFRKLLSQAGVEGEWLEWDRQMHCFPMAFGIGLKECTESLEWICDVLQRT